MGASGGLHLGHVGPGGMAVAVELGLDAEDHEAVVHELLELRGPRVVDVAAGILADVVVVDVPMHQDRRSEVNFGVLGSGERFPDEGQSSVHFQFSIDVQAIAPVGLTEHTLA